MRVLVLEDDPALRFALTQLLEGEGFCVFAADSIKGAARILYQTVPDLLLLDLMIGEEDSIQISDLAGYRAPNAEVIYMTGSQKFPNGELFKMSQNTSWVLRKPVNFTELRAMLAHLARRKDTPGLEPKAQMMTEFFTSNAG